LLLGESLDADGKTLTLADARKAFLASKGE
jgi:hypothetical protein